METKTKPERGYTPKQWFNQLRGFLKAKWDVCQVCQFHDHPLYWSDELEEEDSDAWWEFFFEEVRCMNPKPCVDGNAYQDIKNGVIISEF